MIKKKYKKAILYGKINFRRCQNYSIHMMSQINAPIHSYKNPQIYYLETWKQCFGIWHLTFRIYFNSYRANETRYIDSEVNLRSHFNFKLGNFYLGNKNLDHISERLLVWRVKHSYQQMGAVHPVLGGMDFKFMKVCTIFALN